MQKHALLVGVEDYRDEMISRLNFARADVLALADRLRDRCGFDYVRVLADENGDDEPLLLNIVRALRATSVELRPEDLFLFYFAGHGIEKDGHGFLLARDSLQAFPEHGSLSLQLLRKNFEHLSAGKRILLLDACRNNPDAGRGDGANRMGDAISRDIVAAARSKLTGGTTTVLLSACQSGQRAYEWPDKGHGVFTQYLIEGLDDAAWTNGKIEFDHLAGYVARQVRHWTAGMPGLPIPQEPWYEKFGDPDSIILAGGQSVPSSAGARVKTPSPPRDGKAGPTKCGVHWWLLMDGQEHGPLGYAAVREGIREGSIRRDTQCWRRGMDRWQPVDQTAEYANAFSSLRKTPEPYEDKSANHTDWDAIGGMIGGAFALAFGGVILGLIKGVIFDLSVGEAGGGWGVKVGMIGGAILGVIGGAICGWEGGARDEADEVAESPSGGAIQSREYPIPDEVDQAARCPRCGFTHAWDRQQCKHCGHAERPGSDKRHS